MDKKNEEGEIEIRGKSYKRMGYNPQDEYVESNLWDRTTMQKVLLKRKWVEAEPKIKFWGVVFWGAIVLFVLWKLF